MSRDEFASWDLNSNGDLTCIEARDGRSGDQGLRCLRTRTTGTGVIYEWLERVGSSNSNDDGVGCESISNPNGYIPQPQPPMVTDSCPNDAESWRGLKVCDEQPRDGYDRDAFASGYASLEDEIIDMLPPNRPSSNYRPQLERGTKERASGGIASALAPAPFTLSVECSHRSERSDFMNDIGDAAEIPAGLMENVVDSTSPDLDRISGGRSHHTEGPGPDADEPSEDDYVEDFGVVDD